MASAAALLGLGAPEAATAALSTVGSSCHDGNNPDAELIAWCSELVGRNEAHLAENSPYWSQGIDPPAEVFERQALTTPRYHELKELIGGRTALTMAGTVAKARAVASHIGTIAPSPCSDEYMAWSLASDMLALHGGVA